MTLKIPGKILVIDNNYGDVQEVITSLWRNGQGIVFLEGVPSEEAVPSNVRLVVLDLMLREDGEIQPEDYDQAALALYRISKKTSFYLVALWSIHIDPKDEEQAKRVVETLKRAYDGIAEGRFPTPSIVPFGKNIGHQQLEHEIQQWIESNPEAGLVFQWESSVDSARDEAVSAIVNQTGIRETVKQLMEEVGKEATPREMISLFNRILGRNSISQVEADREAFNALIQAISTVQVVPGDFLKWYSKFHNLQVYFSPHKNEPAWTGDIFYTGQQDPEREFVLILTPACDLAQGKADNLRLACCTKVSPLNQYDTQSEDVAPAVIKLKKVKRGNYKNRKNVVQAIIEGSDLPSNLHVLHFFRMPGEPEYYHLIVDFSMVVSRRCRDGVVTVPAKWKRVARVDSPYMEDLLQKYATFASRIGTLELPTNVISQEKTRMMPTN